ncbi:YrrS family protein [Anaerobacillus sp. MEB173]|uniref:YrrS family protein n=1 Tax=Anaerobacillus sp. MEB173 TaxID=3383345 RepID=UPI003F916B7B
MENSRIEYRKRKKMNKALNISIALVVLVILYVGGKLIFGGSTAEEVAVDDINQQEENIDNVHEEEEAEETNETLETETSVDNDHEMREDSFENVEEPDNNEVVFGPADAEIIEGPWEPIGTVQSEPFVAVYDKEHQNWVEMRQALQYATRLGEDMVIWRLGNGGSPQSAEGIVSTYENRNTPYKVRLEWVEHQGWKPVSVEVIQN